MGMFGRQCTPPTKIGGRRRVTPSEGEIPAKLPPVTPLEAPSQQSQGSKPVMMQDAASQPPRMRPPSRRRPVTPGSARSVTVTDIDRKIGCRPDSASSGISIPSSIGSSPRSLMSFTSPPERVSELDAANIRELITPTDLAA
eukprot:CAMPEP_0114141024 /NCGR_PEP_ID=MMETSP0043_2-20121206/17696_1 /TAXON_ID=464988 /ORGANISM="Hemiselmis andersenii, Strain CCMP644" /LENGTH=141 /DNA_ID=CAMNT_0001235155 /DNA_START=214 /DNA_END=639 /DNA_ORIENTATION=-